MPFDFFLSESSDPTVTLGPLHSLWKREFFSFSGQNVYHLRVIACNSGTQMRVRDSSATPIFFLKNRMMQHRAQNITIKF